MKQLISICCLGLFSLTSPAQVPHVDKQMVNNQLNFACNFFDNNTRYIPPPASAIKDEDAEVWMRSMINRIMSVIGLQNRYRLAAIANFNNCAAVCLNNNIGQDRFIQFDRAFLETFQKKTNNRWFVLGVLAHEIGHHLNGHSLGGVGSRPNLEIEADEFAGFIMQKLGAPLAEAQNIFSFLNDTDGPPTHPVKAKRYEAVKRGWDKAAGKQTLATLSFNDADTKDFAYHALLSSRKKILVTERMEEIDRALQLVPDYTEALSEKGLAFLQMKNYDSAFYYCNIAVKMDPDIGLLRLNLAKVFYKMGDLNHASGFVDDAIYLRPVFSAAYYQRALIQIDNKAWAEASASCDFAVAMQADNKFDLGEILEVKGIALYEQGYQKEAITYFDAAKELNPFSLNIGNYLKKEKIREVKTINKKEKPR